MLCTHALVAEEFRRPRERVVTLVLVRERVLVMLVCLLKFSGWEDNVYSEDYSVNIEKLKRLPVKSTITFIWLLKVTSIRINLYLLKLSTKWSKKKSEKSNLQNKKMLDKPELLRKRPRETTERPFKWDLLMKFQRKHENERSLFLKNPLNLLRPHLFKSECQDTVQTWFKRNPTLLRFVNIYKMQRSKLRILGK